MKDYPKAFVVTTGRDVGTDASIPSNTYDETAVNAQSKSKRRTKTHCAIQRPQYRPAGSHQKPGTKVDGDGAGSIHVILAGDTKEEGCNRMDYDLLGIGLTASDDGGFVAEEGTYAVAQAQEPIRSAAHVGRQQHAMASTPVDRFLSEAGPWSSCAA